MLNFLNKFLHKGFIHYHQNKYHYFSCPSKRQKKVAIYKLRYKKLTSFKSTLKKLSIKEDGIFLDIGANIGYFSLLLSKTFPKSEIFSFEPIEINFRFLNSNSKNIKNINIFNLGLNNKNEIVGFGMPIDNIDGNTGLFSAVNYKSIEKFAFCIRLDDFFKGEIIKKNVISYIKIDAEGMELSILEGMRDLIKLMKPIIRISLNTSDTITYKLNINAIKEFFIGIENYKIYDVNGENVSLDYMNQLKKQGKNGVVHFACKH